MRSKLSIWVTGGVGFWASASTALACAFHGYNPDPTLVDHLLLSEHVVLARPDAANPGKFAAHTAMMGPLEGVDIPLAVDTSLAAQLNAAPEAQVLLARDGAYGPWQQLAVLDTEYMVLVSQVMAQHSAWNFGGDEERFQLFADHVNDQNPEIRRLALRELDRADYTLLSKVKLPPVRGLMEGLKGGDPDLLPIKVLLAGLSGDRQFAPVLAEGLHAGVREDLPFLGAYATALIELGGLEAAEPIARKYLASGAASATTQERIIEAFAIQAQVMKPRRGQALRRIIASALVQAPELAASVARQFAFRSDFSMGNAVRTAATAKKPATVDDIFSINQYLSFASQN